MDIKEHTPIAIKKNMEASCESSAPSTVTGGNQGHLCPPQVNFKDQIKNPDYRQNYQSLVSSNYEEDVNHIPPVVDQFPKKYSLILTVLVFAAFVATPMGILYNRTGRPSLQESSAFLELPDGPDLYLIVRLPQTSTSELVHFICVNGEEASASSNYTELTYTDEPNPQDGLKVWGDQDYVLSDLDSECQNGILLKPSLYIDIPARTEISVQVPYAEDIEVCVYVAKSIDGDDVENQDGGLPELLLIENFTIQDDPRVTAAPPPVLKQNYFIEFDNYCYNRVD